MPTSARAQKKKTSSRARLKSVPEKDAKAIIVSTMRPYFGYWLYKAARRMRETLDGELATLGLVAPQFAVLLLLNETGALSQIEIGESISSDRASIVKLIDGLEKRAFVTRTKHDVDRRINLIDLTTQGRRALKQATLVVRSVEKNFLSKLSAQESERLKGTITKLMES